MTSDRPDDDAPETAVGWAEDGKALVPNEGYRSGRGSKRVLWEVVRSLRVPDDLPLLKQSLPHPEKSVLQIRHSHHQLARLLAQGTPNNECSLITGYSPGHISSLQRDPMFAELIGYYASNEDKKFVDVMDRMRSLGMNTLEELQNRLENNPDSFSLRELMEQVELTLVKPMQAAARSSSLSQNSPIGSGVSVNVKFVSASQDRSIEGDATEIKLVRGRDDPKD